ncbi:tetrathionate reductase family octaheme c-type cytochrome [Breoghania sp.]|uniref:tetrathionate reductase family octaheme c-type cytochrome n=1 Tax=Breoghania sp. TaxID=2065378 RepID=UPI0029CA84AB|nr:tetrathionate reductase family octaheme c-type cytochrome [Breoghania sp.]
MTGIVRNISRLVDARSLLGGLALVLALGAPLSTSQSGAQEPAPEEAASDSTADHSKFKILNGPFASGQDVTKACLTCHNEAGKQVQGSLHWTWDYKHPKTGQTLGKRNVINAFCGNVASNEPRCTSCHIGYGWDDMREPPPADETAVDCLVCHADKELYAKLDNQAGGPAVAPFKDGSKTITGQQASPIDLSVAARSVGAPGRENCGQCHFYGGGGDNVKHGDLSSALMAPERSVDVHMAKDGANFACSTCHVTHAHKTAGSRYDVVAKDTKGRGGPGASREAASCESCHGTKPHPGNSIIATKLNHHTDRIACQTCHIPSFARGGVATKTAWDWSTGGKLKDGKPYHEENFVQSDGKHLHTYLSTKGDFEWGENVVPHYAWFDGEVSYTLAGDTIDPTKVVEINAISGSANDPDARIWPFKRMVGRQAYDKKLNHLVYNKVYGPDTTTAFWTNFDWAKSIKAGMDYMGVPYSGEFGFVDTFMYWPITHMVAPKEDALKCGQCHSKDGRLSDVPGLYIPGAAPFSDATKIGLGILLFVIVGLLGHMVVRLVRCGRKANG